MSLRWQNPQTDASGRERTKESEDAKSLALQGFREKGPSLFGFRETAPQTPCIGPNFCIGFRPFAAVGNLITVVYVRALRHEQVGLRTSRSLCSGRPIAHPARDGSVNRWRPIRTAKARMSCENQRGERMPVRRPRTVSRRQCEIQLCLTAVMGYSALC